MSVSARWLWFVVAALGLAVLGAVGRLAWLSDDAYITLRTVENLLAGHGPVWNVGERVQAYTHPTWFWLLAVARWLTGEHFFTTIVLSVALSGAAAALLASFARTPAAIAAVLLVLLGSRAFGDFATSGLETPLVMLLLALLARVDAGTPPGGARLAAVASLVAWLGATRLDLLVLAAPLLLAHVRRERPLTQIAIAAAATAPLWGWSLFAAWYYGSPFPITAYAKAFSPGVPAGELIVQGLRYVLHTLRHDPVTLLVIGSAIAVGFADASLRARRWAAGIVASCAYVVWVGGDFMAGRFFVPPFVLSLALLARWLAAAAPRSVLAAAAAAVVLPWVGGMPPYLRAPAADTGPIEPENGIQDERRFYNRELGLLSPQRQVPVAGRFTAALRRQGRTRPIVMGSGMAGGVPFLGGELFHFVDPWLCDPLLMRLPVADPTAWRIGHFTRAIPDGYPEAIVFGPDRVVHPGLRSYYTTLRTVLREPLASDERLAALWAQWTARDDALRAAYVAEQYRTPPRRDVAIAPLLSPRPAGTFWFDDEEVLLVGRGGLRLAGGERRAATTVNVLVVPLAVYGFVFRDGEREVGRAELAALTDAGLPPAGDDGGLLGYLQRLLGVQPFTLSLQAPLPPFDTIDVVVQASPWTLPAIGGITFAN